MASRWDSAKRPRVSTYVPVPIPQRLAAPIIADFVNRDEAQHHGWPSPAEVDVRTWRDIRHPLVRLARKRHAAAVLKWRAQLQRDAQYPDDEVLNRRIGSSAIWPRLDREAHQRHEVVA